MNMLMQRHTNPRVILENNMKVLVIEDERDIRDFVVSQFIDQGMEAVGLEAGDGILERLDHIQPDVLVLDQLMPGKSGTDIVREVRSSAKYSELPIMMVTGLDGETDKIKAFEVGADDYVTKPFSIREVIARTFALARRSNLTHKATQSNIALGELTVDFNAHRVTLHGQEVALTLTEFKILAELLKQSGNVLTRDRLREKALGNLNVTDRTIDVHMASLRKKLNSMGDSIETVRGVGYRLVI